MNPSAPSSSISIRQHFALECLKAVIVTEDEASYENAAIQAVRHADALIGELNKDEPDTDQESNQKAAVS